MRKHKIKKFKISQNFSNTLYYSQCNGQIDFKKTLNSFSLTYKKDNDKKEIQDKKIVEKIQKKKVKKQLKTKQKKNKYQRTKKKEKKEKKKETFKIKKDHQVCSVCLEYKSKNDFLTFKFCKHTFCIECLIRYTQSRFKQKIFALKCPSCQNFVTEQLAVLVPYNQKFMKFLRKRIQTDQEEIGLENYEEVECPIEGCEEKCRKLKSADYYFCINCLSYICALCNSYDHEEKNCLKISEKFLDKKFDKLQAEQQYKRCPQCFYYIEKNGGCASVTCRCGYSMNYYSI